MKSTSSFYRNCRVWIGVCILFAILGGWQTTSAQTNFPGDVSIQGEIDVHGNTFNLGSWSNNSSQLGLNATYAEDGNHAATLTLLGNRPVSNWLWQQLPVSGTTPVRQLLLGSNNVLTLYDKATPQNSAIVLDPLVRSTFQTPVTFNGSDNRMPNQTANDNTSVLTVGLADSRYLAQFVGSSISLGTSANASGQSSTALGAYSIASGPYSTALSYGTHATGQYTVALGDGSEAVGANSVALGANSAATGDNASTLGDFSVASGWGSSTFGTGSSATNTVATALGAYRRARPPTTYRHHEYVSSSAASVGGNGRFLGDRSVVSRPEEGLHSKV